MFTKHRLRRIQEILVSAVALVKVTETEPGFKVTKNERKINKPMKIINMGLTVRDKEERERHQERFAPNFTERKK